MKDKNIEINLEFYRWLREYLYFRGLKRKEIHVVEKHIANFIEMLLKDNN